MFRSRSLLPLLGLAALALLATPPVELTAQDTSIEWTERNWIEASGVLGALLGRLPRATGETKHGLHVQGNRVRQDHGSTTTIFDLEARRWITLDHDEASYLDFSIDDLRESMLAVAEVQAEVAAEVAAMREEVAEEFGDEWTELMAEMERAMREAEASFDVRIRSESTGETRTVGPATAQRHFVTVEIEAAGGFGAMEGVDGEVGEGTLVLLVDLWKSRDFPDPDRVFEEFGRQLAEDPEMRRIAEETAATLAPLGEAFGPEALALWDPRIAAAMRRAGEAMAALEGTTVYSATHVAMVPEGVQFDRNALLAWEPESMGDRLRAGAADQAGAAAREAARGAVRGLTRGLMGRGGGVQEERAADAEVRPLLRYVSEMADIRVSEPGPALFAVPGNYRRQELPDFGELLRERREEH